MKNISEMAEPSIPCPKASKNVCKEIARANQTVHLSECLHFPPNNGHSQHNEIIYTFCR